MVLNGQRPIQTRFSAAGRFSRVAKQGTSRARSLAPAVCVVHTTDNQNTKCEQMEVPQHLVKKNQNFLFSQFSPKIENSAPGSSIDIEGGPHCIFFNKKWRVHQISTNARTPQGMNTTKTTNPKKGKLMPKISRPRHVFAGLRAAHLVLAQNAESGS